METQFAPNYLVQLDPSNLPVAHTDVLVLGSGIAGSRAAVEAAVQGEVVMVTKETFRESNTNYALGGIAASLNPEDSPGEHAADTIQAAKGLGEEELIRDVTREGVQLVEELMEWGADFDRVNGDIDFTKEGGHSAYRVLHAGGDQTGREIARVLEERVKASSRIQVREDCFAVDLLVEDGICHGVIYRDGDGNNRILLADATVLCTGGAGQVFRETTNPKIATGDGLAMAYRAGARLRDLEFYQFHPTTLYVAGSGRSLISESVRGEGGKLVDRSGERFMEEVHESGDLAPRDIVSRGIVNHLSKTGDTSVYLDLTDLGLEYLEERFPRLVSLCREFELDPGSDLIPVHPSAHYQIGGVWTDASGRTSVDRLFAAGEVASTGFHGANRLGSNSLLEGLVFGYRAGAATVDCLGDRKLRVPDLSFALKDRPPPKFIDLEDLENSIKSLNWRQCGIVRSGEGLRDALFKMNFWCGYLLDREFDARMGWELQNIFTISRLMTHQALKRKESRGVHYRSDFPDQDEAFDASMTITRDQFRDELPEHGER